MEATSGRLLNKFLVPKRRGYYRGEGEVGEGGGAYLREMISDIYV